ncbi:hypothetical protein CAEBREN_24663 [Caenorhabditis brenneri]|uniref:Uncharacterized protein n=1 Tax=Caenorhabditis brenneri TaxID=135651 RepID=G0N0D9_CAEBE|nr:hypothetical protein CAEBREN_24663 [Caenorhabditis brenneri]
MASDSEYSSGGETHHSQPPSLRRQKKIKTQQTLQQAEQSLYLKIVGPAKARVTNVTEEADRLLETGQTIADTLSKLTPNMESRPETLKSADSFLLEAKRTVHNLCSLYNYVDVILRDISMNESPFKDRYLAEAYTLIAKANPHVLAKQLHEMIFSLEAQLKELGYPLTSYVPPEDDESEPIHTMEHDMKLTCENNGLSNEPLITQKSPSNLEQTRKILEPEEEVKSLQRQSEKQQIHAVLNEQDSSHASILHEQQIPGSD